MEIIKRKEAKEQGLSRYFTGKACKNGHISERQVSKGNCLECMYEHYKNNKDKIIERAALYNKTHKEKRKAAVDSYYQRNKEKLAVTGRKWKQENKGKVRSYKAKRKAIQLKAMPKWADLKAIENIYANKPEGYHVDHIVPLISDKVCGLHVENNLQYLTAEQNLKKSNTLDYTDF
jgi:hypothetical protein